MLDLAADCYAIGVRYADQVEKDMIAVHLTPVVQTIIVGSPAYLAWHTRPTTPQEPMQHNCITLRMASSSGIYAWKLERDGKAIEVRVRVRRYLAPATRGEQGKRKK